MMTTKTDLIHCDRCDGVLLLGPAGASCPACFGSTRIRPLGPEERKHFRKQLIEHLKADLPKVEHETDDDGGDVYMLVDGCRVWLYRTGDSILWDNDVEIKAVLPNGKLGAFFS
ncbi:MAG: hypothetical protein GTO41_19965 [Burkholderiales bacterium]|nr:hypothetical protein [Burkholderiales bacterium]